MTTDIVIAFLEGKHKHLGPMRVLSRCDGGLAGKSVGAAPPRRLSDFEPHDLLTGPVSGAHQWKRKGFTEVSLCRVARRIKA